MAELKLQDLVPIRWPSGPLEIARREKDEGFGARARQTLERWHEPAALDMLKNTPVDCVVLSWAAGLPADAAQWRTVAPLVEAARRRDLAVIGWVEGAADHRPALAAAKSAGLSAVALRNFKGGADLPVLAWSERGDVPWDSPAPLVAIAGNVWPSANPAAGGGDANAGPTGLPWLDSNGWYIQMARARLRPPLWVVFDPPGKRAAVPARGYVNAICDSEAAGARWPISLDDDLRAGMAEGAAPALESWSQIWAAARFFQQHGEWRPYVSLGLVGVISDFTGEDFALSGEILNLMARRDLLFRVIWKSQAARQALAGLKAVVYADAAPPSPALRRQIADFVETGGLAVTGPGWGAEGKPAPPDFSTQFDVRAVGKGRLAVARDALTDPYQVAVETQFLLSHRYDLVKIYNAPSAGSTRFTAPAGGRKALLQCLSYADAGRGGLRTIWVHRKFAKTRLWTIGEQPVPIEPAPSEEYTGVEYHLPANASRSYVALEFEEQGGTK